MTVKEQLMTDLLAYPMLMKNKWSCYHQWFSVDGNLMEWIDGELVSDIKIPLTNVNLAIDKLFSQNIETESENIRNYSGDLFDCGSDEMIALEILSCKLKTIVSDNILLKNKIKLIYNVETRIVDMSQSEDFYGLTEESILCNLPEDDINDDWKEACQEYYDWIGDNLNIADEKTKKLFYNIKTSWLKLKVSEN